MKDLYIVSYKPDGEGAPYFFDSKWVPDLPAFHFPSENPVESTLSTRYHVTADSPGITADWLPDHFLASKSFLEICDQFACSYISRPVDIDLQGTACGKEYFFFVPSERISAMNLEDSVFTLDRNPKIDGSKSDDPVYERIDRLKVSGDVDSHFFYFNEIAEVICSTEFRNECIRKSISGLSFKMIGEHYQYAPWDDF
ncbi:imm11 family protein [Pseudomonas folii]|uniref:Immunity MXAN-0049 protein domain-containing protein n=1 Tax=Pseudomonas folii TaxID=2762593 RepID=A0ABR7B2X1_9PSED|nr:hypothetical protein [Pseudomonas folii]MBC3951526.1 hypothetical protein [Pseudomonas folii]